MPVRSYFDDCDCAPVPDLVLGTLFESAIVVASSLSYSELGAVISPGFLCFAFSLHLLHNCYEFAVSGLTSGGGVVDTLDFAVLS